MLKSKFLDIVKTFSTEEFREFRNFVRSPFHNTNKNVIKITEILNKYFPDLENVNLQKEKLFDKIYPGKKYNDTVMRILLSDLLKLAEEYLAYYNFVTNPIEEKKFLLHELDKRKLNSLFRHHLKIASEELNKNFIDPTHFADLFELQSIKIDNMISEDKQHESSEEVLKQGESLITFFLIHILNIAHELATHKEVLNLEFNFNIVEEFIGNFNINNFIKKTSGNDYKYRAVLLIYYHMYLSMIQPDNDDNYFKLKELVMDNFDMFKREEKFNLFIILESICTTSISSGKRHFYEKAMELYKLMLSKNIYTHSDSEFFQLNLFRNIFYTAIVLKEFEWAESFTKEYLNKVMPLHREDISHLANAYIYFEKKEFEKALGEISSVNYKFFVFKYDVRILTLKIYYELDSFEPALSLIDTFTHFLSNNKTLSGTNKDGFLNFLKFLKHLIKMKSGDMKNDSFNFKREIGNTERLMNKNWLLEKAGEL